MSYSKEPTIRIGIVLPEDGMASIHCSIPDHPYSVSGGPERQDPIRGTRLTWSPPGIGYN